MARKGENIYKRKDGRWEGRYKIGVKPDGTAKYHSIYGKSYLAVKTQITVLKAKQKTEPISSGRVTVAVLVEEWLTSAQNRVKPSTFANYRLKADKHLLPEFGGIRYDALTSDIVQRFIREKLENGLSAKYVTDIVTVLKSVTKYAETVHGYRNPLLSVILPKVGRRDKELLSGEQQKQLCKFLTDNMNITALCVMLSLFTGLRVGEVCGLMWEDIDFEKRILTVNRTVQRIRTERGTMLHIGSPKSVSSRRAIPIPDFLIRLLKVFRRQDHVYLLSGSNNIL